MRYSDVFDINWNKDNFDETLDIKHYKIHGSVIWYKNLRTNECVKIPVHAFYKGKPVKLRLIYGDEVEPLLIYPAQKSEYVEPLTELQLMFKQRLKETTFLVVVGYSFRDDYIVHMLWDAARVNENLHVVLIGPDSQEIYEKKLKFINPKDNIKSRISERVICLPYPFKSVIGLLRTYYLNNLRQLLDNFKSALNNVRVGNPPNWDSCIRLSIECCFLTKTEELIQRSDKEWQNMQLGSFDNPLEYAFKALLHSVICRDGNEEKWLERVNNELKTFSSKNLKFEQFHDRIVFFFDKNGYPITMKDILERWLDPLFKEKRKVETLLTPRYANNMDRIKSGLTKLEKLRVYFSKLLKGVNWRDYEELKDDSPEVKSIIREFKDFIKTKEIYPNRINIGSLTIEQERLKTMYRSESFIFELDPP